MLRVETLRLFRANPGIEPAFCIILVRRGSQAVGQARSRHLMPASLFSKVSGGSR